MQLGLYLLATEVRLVLTAVRQAVQELRDENLRVACEHLAEQTHRQQAWLLTKLKHRGGHTLAVPQ